MVAARVRETGADVCATGGLSPHFAHIGAVLDAARAARPDMVNLVGGGVFSSDPALAGEVLDIDVGVIGEGEETVVELAAALEAGGDLGGVRGIAYRKNGTLVRTPGRPTNRDLDSLP